MKKLVGVTIMVTMFVLTVPSVLSFEPEKGFYAEYRMGADPGDPHPTIFALLRERREWEIKFLGLEDLIYKYQILNIEGNTATVRVCFEGSVYAGGYNIANQRAVAFKRIYNVHLDLDTLEMVDKKGNTWGKWLFWIPLGSYDKKEYTVMENWNGHGKVKGVLKGPLEYENLSSILTSPYAKNLTHCFCLQTHRKEDGTRTYPLFKDYGIVPSHNAYETDEGSITIKSGGYYLGEEGGYISDFFYTDEGLLLEVLRCYIDDFIDQKVGIVVLKGGCPLTLTNYGVSNDILIEDPTLESQRTSFEKEVEMMVGKNKSEETPPKTENPPETQITESPQKTEEKSEIPSSTKPQPNEKDRESVLFYLASIVAIILVAVFIVLREKR